MKKYMKTVEWYEGLPETHRKILLTQFGREGEPDGEVKFFKWLQEEWFDQMTDEEREEFLLWTININNYEN
jgi:hypothetical protein